MTEKQVKISPQQLFCVLLLSRLSAEIVYPRTSAGTASESVIALLISEAVWFLLALPLIIYSFGGSNFHRSVYRRNKFFGWAGAIAAALLLVFAAAHTLYSTSLFAVKSIQTGGAMWLIFVIAAAFALYAASMGVEALSRTSGIILIGAAAVTIAVMLCSIPQINSESFAAMTENGSFDSLVGDIINRLTRGGDYLIFAALLPYVRTEKNTTRARCVLLFTLVSVAGSIAVTVVNCLVLRQLYGLCEYPILAVASLSDIAIFKRLDGITAAFWSLAAALRGGIMLLSARCAPIEVYRAGHCENSEEGAL